MKKVVWGVLSTSAHGLARVVPPLKRSHRCELRAIASRSKEKAEKAAREAGIPVAYGSYEELLADPEIEVVFNTAPNHLHVPLTLKAAAAGKHVLCEKPIAMTAAEAETLRATVGKVLVMEAFMVRFHPQWERAREWVRAGRLGELRAIQTFQAYFNVDPANVRNVAAIGGGALYDTGCYGITTARHFFEAEPVRAIGLFDRDTAFGTDRLVSAILDFGGARHHAMTVSTQCARRQRAVICGTKGWIELEVPFNPAPDAETRIFIGDGSRFDGRAVATETLAAADQYLLQCDAFSRAVRGEIELPYGVDNAILNMRAVDALFRSEKSGTWETV